MRVHAVPLGFSQAYVLESEAGLFLVDAGLPHQESTILRHLRLLGQAQDKAPGVGDPKQVPSLRLIFITHAHLDHYGSAAAIRRQTGAPVAIHHADADAMAQGETRLGLLRGKAKPMGFLLPMVELLLRPEPVTPDLLLEDGDSLAEYGLEATVIHTPGHTFGSSCLIVEGRTGFVGDLLTHNHQPQPQRLFAEDWALLEQSYARLQEVELEAVYPGHGRRPADGKAWQQLMADQAGQ